jgi:hypothetical protein
MLYEMEKKEELMLARYLPGYTNNYNTTVLN